MVTALITTDDIEVPEIPHVVEKKVVGDTGFEPVISSVLEKRKFWSQFGHSSKKEFMNLMGSIEKKNLNNLDN